MVNENRDQMRGLRGFPISEDTVPLKWGKGDPGLVGMCCVWAVGPQWACCIQNTDFQVWQEQEELK